MDKPDYESIRNKAELTAQETYDFVKAHLYFQGQRSLRLDRYYCAYRGQDQTSCAVGCLMTDSEAVAADRVVSNSIRYLIRNNLAPSRFHHHGGLLDRLQMVHDSLHAPAFGSVHEPAPTTGWAFRLLATAKEFGLTP